MRPLNGYNIYGRMFRFFCYLFLAFTFTKPTQKFRRKIVFDSLRQHRTKSGPPLVDKWVAKGNTARAMQTIASYHCRRVCGKWLRQCQGSLGETSLYRTSGQLQIQFNGATKCGRDHGSVQEASSKSSTYTKWCTVLRQNTGEDRLVFRKCGTTAVTSTAAVLL